MNNQITGPRSVQTAIYNKSGWVATDVQPDKESAAYNGCRFTLNGKCVIYREAKITPTKPGLFVTVWKRNEQGITAPFDRTDGIDLVVIDVRKDQLSGQFVFPVTALVEHGVFSANGKDGKRGFRVYPPWEQDLNKKATKTQQWQVAYFLKITDTDLERLKELYGLH
ncbi:hypothetical protein CJD36_016360 [Flavipsychrobacter stenotrophus]|uniref:MepB family protein n=1 Tax=Flavipsychrobacter stenotrophus TaxID=2077091 RepID=A0A2S7SUF3_9BACT|nr:MepB family protein [Flavipsychrobacter stenotrophus]PQJ10257.1 hypothetical protein CJD36_016360 [Flavipsychrobacter stenotrophus]